MVFLAFGFQGPNRMVFCWTLNTFNWKLVYCAQKTQADQFCKFYLNFIHVRMLIFIVVNYLNIVNELNLL